MSLNGIASWGRAHYDKLIAVAVLLGLFASLIYLAVRVSMIRSMQRDFDRTLVAMRPAHPVAKPTEVAPYEGALAEIRDPGGFTAWDRPMFVPGKRVLCVDCRRPIPYDTKDCPFCNKVQPVDEDQREDFDGDLDGMWDSWERQHGLNPRDSSDAELDNDGDGFLNVEEFGARTDPKDPKSSPSYLAKLRVKEIREDPFELRFRGTSKMADGSLRFQLNLRGNQKTFFKKLEEEVEGFVLHSYDEKMEVDPRTRLKRDVSVLTLKRGDKLIPLIRGRETQWNEYAVTLIFTLDNSEYSVKLDEIFELKGKKYVVAGLSVNEGTVAVREMPEGKESTIPRYSEANEGNAAGGVSPFPLTDQGENRP